MYTYIFAGGGKTALRFLTLFDISHVRTFWGWRAEANNRVCHSTGVSP